MFMARSPRADLLTTDRSSNLPRATEVNHENANFTDYSALASILASAQTYTESVLYNFGSVSGDGAQPNALVMDSSGNLYGTTEQGGNSAGTVYKLTGSGMETILHTFLGGADGSYPLASLTIDKSGNLYGTTYGSGTGPTGCGTVFKVT
jgi:uncharacterized repeat protein (TIGR03803 family)